MNKVYAIFLATALTVCRATADDGLVLSVVNKSGMTNALVLFTIKDDRAQGYTVIDQNVMAGSFSPDGERVAIVKNTKNGGGDNQFGICDLTKTPLTVQYLGTVPNMGVFNNYKYAGITWTSGENGKWVYWVQLIDYKALLRRIHVDNYTVETVVAFDVHFGGHSLTRDLSPTTGTIFIQSSLRYENGEDSRHVLYRMSAGDGKLTTSEIVPGGDCGTGISPDGKIGVRNDDLHQKIYFTSLGADLSDYPILSEKSAVEKYGFLVNAYNPSGGQCTGDRTEGSRFGVNSNDWIIIAQHNSSDKKSFLGMYNARKRKQICVSMEAGLGPLSSCYTRDIFMTSGGTVGELGAQRPTGQAAVERLRFTVDSKALHYTIPANETRTLQVYRSNGVLVHTVHGARSAGTIPLTAMAPGTFVLRAVNGEKLDNYAFALVK